MMGGRGKLHTVSTLANLTAMMTAPAKLGHSIIRRDFEKCNDDSLDPKVRAFLVPLMQGGFCERNTVLRFHEICQTSERNTFQIQREILS